MKADLPQLSNVIALLAVAEHGRFNRAADALAVTESAVSHQIRKLEEQLGTRLVDRHRHGAILTASGHRFHDKASEAVRLLTEAVDDVSGTRFGKVTLTLPRALATHWLVPRYGALHRMDPNIELQLLPTTRLCDLRRERIELGIRYGDGAWPGLETCHLLNEVCFPVACPDNAHRWHETGWNRLRHKDRVFVNNSHPDEWREWCMSCGLPPPNRRRVTHLDSFDLVLQAGLSGAGLIMGRRPMIDDFIRRGELIAPFGSEVFGNKRYFAVWPADRPLSPKSRIVLKWLQACAEKSAVSPAFATPAAGN